MTRRNLTLLCLSYFFSATCAHANFRFTILDDRNPFYGYSNSSPLKTSPAAINNNGQVIGSACCNFTATTDSLDAFLYDHGNYNCMFYSVLGGCVQTQFLNLGQVPIGLPNAYPSENITGFNNAQTFVGSVQTFGGPSVGYIQYGLFNAPPDIIRDPNVILGDTFVTGINDSGKVVGYWADYANSTTGGFLFQNGSFTNLDFQALAINGLGQIVGLDPTTGHVVLLSNGKLKDLGVFPFVPSAINDSGVIVGGSQYYANGVFRSIQVPGATSTTVVGVNDSNTFVGSFTTPEGTFGYIANTPEPSYAVLLLMSLTAIAVRRRCSR